MEANGCLELFRNRLKWWCIRSRSFTYGGVRRRSSKGLVGRTRYASAYSVCFFLSETGIAFGRAAGFCKYNTLTFEKPDTTRFRNLALAYEALHQGGNMPLYCQCGE